ncbi:MAG: alpha/beta fold hydrolase [Deltaproteobacteria bacterium]|nr:alpha/beta fold hydrolase [Deltaproteobacteria bacterium]
MDHLSSLPRTIADAWRGAATQIAGLDRVQPAPALMPTPRDVIMTDGTAALYRFARPATAPAAPKTPIVLIPSLINRWYVLDLRAGASLVEALTSAGLDVWCLDWGIPEDEDRHRSWTDVLDRLARMLRRVRRETGAAKVALCGYCMGGTLATIHTALHPDEIAALIDLAGPIDFAKGGMLRRMVDPAWFDADAIADAGNVAPAQMQAGFTALRPTLDLAKLVGLGDLVGDAKAQLAYRALETWSSDNIPFPGDAYRTYITELYQGNALVNGTHRVRGKAVTLAAITCPTLAIVADRDTICPPPAAIALTERVGTTDTAVLRVPGGHVGAVVGGRAAREMYPGLIAWLRPRLVASSQEKSP